MLLLCCLVSLALGGGLRAFGGHLRDTIHDIRFNKSCELCHTPRRTETKRFDVYAGSSSIVGTSSMGCLACHNYSISLGMQGREEGGHLTSIPYASTTLPLKELKTLPLYWGVEVRCLTCHVPHKGMGVNKSLLRKTKVSLCNVCHYIR